MNSAEGEAIRGGGELVHEGEAEVVLRGREIDFKEAAREFPCRLPADLTSEPGLIARRLEAAEVLQEEEEGWTEGAALKRGVNERERSPAARGG